MSTFKSILKEVIKPIIHSVFGDDDRGVAIENLLLEDGFDFLLEDGGYIKLE